jgi:type II secretory pathway pseudopilin PulG
MAAPETPSAVGSSSPLAPAPLAARVWLGRLASLAVLAICAGGMLLVIAMPALSASRHTARRIDNELRLRELYKACLTYADANQCFPGFTKEGAETDLTVEGRYQALFVAKVIDPARAISQLEPAALTPWAAGQKVTPKMYSYAMLQIPKEGERRKAWSPDPAGGAVILADRNTGTPAQPASLHWARSWRGSVCYADGIGAIARYVTSPVLKTEYGFTINEEDNLFEAAGNDDAYLVHSGN